MDFHFKSDYFKETRNFTCHFSALFFKNAENVLLSDINIVAG